MHRSLITAVPAMVRWSGLDVSASYEPTIFCVSILIRMMHPGLDHPPMSAHAADGPCWSPALIEPVVAAQPVFI